MAANYDFTGLTQGDALTQQFIWKDSSGTPIDLTGYTAKMQIRRGPGQPVILELSTANTKIVLGGVAGTIDLAATGSDMSFCPDVYQYDLQVELVPGNPTTLVKGSLVLLPQITT